MKRFNLLLLFVMALFLTASANAKIVYEVIDLGTLGGDASWAYSINNKGHIVGFALDSSGNDHATLFDPTGSGNNICLSSSRWSDAAVINDYGQIVGREENAYGQVRAILYDPTGSGNNIDLGTLGGNEAGAYSINNSGQIVGTAVTSYGQEHATLFDPTGGGNNIDLGTRIGTIIGLGSRAEYINDLGQIVGGTTISDVPYPDYHATLFDPTGNGNNINLGTLGGNESGVWSINNSGQIVGVAQDIFGNSHATLFDASGGGNNIDLGTIGGTWSRALSINDNGQIVGDGWKSSTEFIQVAIMFDPTGGGNNIDLNTLIDPASGWHLINATSINNQGWIVGGGSNPQGEWHAYLLVPEPATIALLGLGALLLRKHRK